MPIEFPCTSCGSPLKVPDEFAGKTAKCPKCGSLNTIPIPGQERPIQGQADFSAPVKQESNPFASSQLGSASPARRSPGSIVIRRLDVGSFALMSGGVSALMGLVIGLIYGLVIGLVGVVGMGAAQGGAQALGFGIGMGIASIIFIPAMYGVSGLIFGAIWAVSFNFVAKFVGGVRIETS